MGIFSAFRRRVVWSVQRSDHTQSVTIWKGSQYVTTCADLVMAERWFKDHRHLLHGSDRFLVVQPDGVTHEITLDMVDRLDLRSKRRGS